MSVLRTIGAFALAVVLTNVLGVIAAAQMVLARLTEIGAEITIGDRLAMTLDDLVGLSPTYLPVILLGFAVALPAAALVGRVLPLPRGLVFAVAGAVSLGVTLLLMREVFFGVTAIAGARGAVGAGLQVAAGAVGAWAFAALTPPPAKRRRA